MRTIEADDAKTHFDAVLAEVAAGATVEVAKHGIPDARLVPVRNEFADAAAAIEEWERYRNEHNLTLGDGITIRELIEEGRE